MRSLIAVLSLLPILAVAETAYVTDNLRLGLHQASDTSDRAFRTLDSGQEVEILSRDRNYARVRLPEGAEGYVKAAYLVDDKPAKLIVNETIAERDRLNAELEELRQQFAGPAAAIATLEQETAELQDRLALSAARIEELDEQNSDLRARQAQYKFSLPLVWVGGAIGVCLIGGFLLGLWWVDHRSRQRHGGIRIY
ncbi:MAG: TIGR04211 family SH3 domain-containing protein [Gammaproteobacteria bacterium]|nr:TIGR04211 family SH3 domain-containing protein [Gammaproteobacteria bacterium]